MTVVEMAFYLDFTLDEVRVMSPKKNYYGDSINMIVMEPLMCKACCGGMMLILVSALVEVEVLGVDKPIELCCLGLKVCSIVPAAGEPQPVRAETDVSPGFVAAIVLRVLSLVRATAARKT